MAKPRPSNDLSKLLFKLHHHKGYDASRYFRWMVEDVLREFGVKKTDVPPKEVFNDSVFELSGQYANEVIDHDPFYDVLGQTYMDLVSHYGQKALGQYFTPPPIALMMAMMTYQEREKPYTKLARYCDPAVGSGVMLLSTCQTILKHEGAEAFRWLSLTGVDLDSLCARMFPMQILSNCFIHQFEIGELIAFHGNALGNPADWNIVAHSARPDLVAEPIDSLNVAVKNVRAQAAANEQLELFGELS